MGSGAIIAAAIGGGAALALVVASRKKADASSPSSDPCAPLKGVNQTAYDACKAAGGIWKIFGEIAKLGDPQWAKKNTENIAKNGEVEIPIAAQVQSCLGWPPTVAGTSIGYVPLQGNVLRFKNGCVPFPGAKGWEKCSPGTHPMWGGPGNGSWSASSEHPAGTFSMIAADLLTGSHVVRSDRDGSGRNVLNHSGDASSGNMFFTGSNLGACGKFPIPIPTGGVGGYYRGRPFACPANTTPQFLKVDAAAPWVTPKCVANRPTDGPFGGGGTWNPWPSDVEPTPRPRGGVVVTSTPRK